MPDGAVLPYDTLVLMKLTERRFLRVAEHAEEIAAGLSELIEKHANVFDPVKVSDVRDALCDEFWEQFERDVDRAEAADG